MAWPHIFATLPAGKSPASDIDDQFNALSGTASGQGSALVGFLQSGIGAIAEDQQSRGRWFVLATDRMTTTQRADVFTNGGAVDVLAALNAAVTDAVANRSTILWPAGTYTISDVLDLSHSHLIHIMLGKVIIKHTGTGKAVQFDGGAVSGSVYGTVFGWGNPPYIQGNANTTDLLYARATHHSKISANVRDGTTALNQVFCVETDFDIVCSVNDGAFSTTPTNGLLTTRRGASESSSGCRYTLIIEGVSGYGMDLQYCSASTFNGTSEGNGGGVRERSTCVSNDFTNFDCESNGSSNQDWLVEGDRATHIGCVSALTTTAPATSVTGARNHFIGGTLSSLTVSGDWNVFDGVAITGTRNISSQYTTMVNCVDSTGSPIPPLYPRIPQLFDDFFGAALSSIWGSKKGSNGSCNIAAGQSIAGGVVRLITGADAGGTLALNGAQIDQGVLQWSASTISLAFEISFRTDKITNMAMCFGFTDQVSSLEIPFNGSGVGDGITSTASNAVCVMRDTVMTTADWWLCGVKADTDATSQDSGVAPLVSTYETWRIELTAGGAATFYRNGSSIGTQMANAITASTSITPVFCAYDEDGTSAHIDIDYIKVWAK